MALLTDEQLHAIRELIREHHQAFVVNTIGAEAVTDAVLERLQERGLIDVEVATIGDAYLYGQALAAATDPKVANMSLDEFKAHLRRNPVQLSDQERRAIDFAQHQAAQYAVGLGNRIDTETGQLLIDADKALETQRRTEIRTATAENIAQRKSIKDLVSELKWRTKDWKRDWDRIAVTEKHNAMQQGMADSYRDRFGGDVRVAKRPNPDACKWCLKLHLGADGQPRIFKLRDLERNGTNYGKKAVDWQPVTGSVHPNCSCQMIRVPEGWGFDENGDLVPDGELGQTIASTAQLKRSMAEEDELRKAFKLHGRTEFHGLPIAIENRKGSVRKWTNVQGERGQTRMLFAYGYIEGTGGADGDEIDCYLGPDARSDRVFIVHQLDATGSAYDEDKCFLGFSSEAHARAVYHAHMRAPDGGPQTEAYGGMSSMTLDQFKRWIAFTDERDGHTMDPEKLGTAFTIPLDQEAFQKLAKREPELVLTLEKARYTRRWRGPDGKWRYEYAQPEAEAGLKYRRVVSGLHVAQGHMRTDQGPLAVTIRISQLEGQKRWAITVVAGSEQIISSFDAPIGRSLADAKEIVSGEILKTTWREDPEYGWVMEPSDKGLEKAEARGGKYIRREPYTDRKGKQRFRYFYKETAAAREAKAGVELRLGKQVAKVIETKPDGTMVLELNGKRRTVTPNQWHNLLIRHYGQAYTRSAERRARQTINAVLRVVPRELLEDLKGETDAERLAEMSTKVPEVYAKLQGAFKRAGVSPYLAKRTIERTLERRRWEPEARALVIGTVIRHRDIGVKDVISASESLSGGRKVEARHVATVIDLRAPQGRPERFVENIKETAESAEKELAGLSAMLARVKTGETPAAEALAAALSATAVQKLNLLLQAFPGIQDKVAQQAREILPQVGASAPRAPTTEGAETTVYVAGEGGKPTAMRARYRLVEAPKVIASHTHDTFAKHPDYPEGVQERAYHRDKAEQAKVIRNAQKMNPQFVINTNPDAVNGPPLVTKAGIVLGGNSRVMSMQRVYTQHPEKAQQLKTYLAEHAQEVGFTADDVNALENPILIREVEVEDASKRGLQLLVRQMNESFTQGMDPRTMQVAMGRRLSDNDLATLAGDMGEDETLSAFLASNRSERFVASLFRAGVIDNRNLNQYMQRGTRKLNNDGVVLVSRILVGRTVQSADILSDTGVQMMESIARAVPSLVQAKASGAGYDIGDDLATAVDAFNDLQRRATQGLLPGLPSLDPRMSPKLYDRLLDQFQMLPGIGERHPVLDSPKAQKLLEVLVRKRGPVQMAGIFREYARQAAQNPEGQATMFGPAASPEDVLTRVVDEAMGRGEKAPELLAASFVRIDEEHLEKAGPFIGPRGGKWADPQHTIPWKERKARPTRQLDDDYTGPIDSSSTLEEAEQTIQKLPIEHCAVYVGGEMVFRKAGSKGSIGFTPDEIAKLHHKGATFTHNHPRSGCLSVEDVSVAVQHNLKEMRAVAAKGTIYSLRRPAAGWFPSMTRATTRATQRRAAREIEFAYQLGLTRASSIMDKHISDRGGIPGDSSHSAFSQELFDEFVAKEIFTAFNRHLGEKFGWEIQKTQIANRPTYVAERRAARPKPRRGQVRQEQLELFRSLQAIFDLDAEPLEKALYIGPRGGKWADPQHTIPYDPKKHGAPQLVLPLAGKPTKAPVDQPKPGKYRYGMALRPIGLGTIPKGAYMTETHPDFNHGLVVYDKPLTPEEIKSYDLVPILNGTDIDNRVSVAVGEVLSDYPEEVRKLAEEDPRNFAAMAHQAIVEQGPGHLPDIDVLVEQVRKQVVASGKTEETPSEIKVRIHKKIASHGGEATYRVVAEKNGKVKISRHEGSDYGPTMPKESLKHFVNDLAGKVALPKHGNAYIDAVVTGKAEFLGKGDDGLAFRVGDKVVKVSTTVPFQPENPGHRTPDEAVAMLRAQAEMGNMLADKGIEGIQRSEFIVHGDKGFQIKAWVEIPEKFTREQLDAVQDTLIAVHKAGYSINDAIQPGLDNGKPVMFDVGKASKIPEGEDPTDIYSRVRGDMDNMRYLYQEHGHEFVRRDYSEGQQALERAHRDFEKWMKVAPKFAHRHVSVAVAQRAKELKVTLSGKELDAALDDLDLNAWALRVELEDEGFEVPTYGLAEKKALEKGVRGPALGVTGSLATEIGAQTSPAIEHAPGHGTFPNLIVRYPVKRTSPGAHPDVIGYDSNEKDPDELARERAHMTIDPDTRMPDRGVQAPYGDFEVYGDYYTGDGWPIIQTPVRIIEPEITVAGDMRGPNEFPGRSGPVVTTLESQDWHPQDSAGIDEMGRNRLDARVYRQVLGEERHREPQPVPPGIAPYTDEGHRATERAERKRLEENEVKNRQRPRNTVDVEDGN